MKQYDETSEWKAYQAGIDFKNKINLYPDVDRFLVYRLLSTMSMEEYYTMMERTA